jgi:hypothetical protein
MMLAQLILVAHLPDAFTPVLTAMITTHVLKTPATLQLDVSTVPLTAMMIMHAPLMTATVLLDV